MRSERLLPLPEGRGDVGRQVLEDRLQCGTISCEHDWEVGTVVALAAPAPLRRDQVHLLDELVRKHVDHVPVHGRSRDTEELGQLRDRAWLAVDGVEDQFFRAVVELALVDDGHQGPRGGDRGGTGTRETEPVIVINEEGVRQSSQWTPPKDA